LDEIIVNYWTLLFENMRPAAAYIPYWSSTYVLPQAAWFFLDNNFS